MRGKIKDKLMGFISIFAMLLAMCFIISVPQGHAALSFTEQTDADFDIDEDVLDVAMGDLDADGLNDVAAIVKTGSTYKVRIWENTSSAGNASFAASNVVYSSASRVLNKILLANLNSATNANTQNDIIVCANYDGATSNQQILIWKNPGKDAGTVFADSWNTGSPNAMFGGVTSNINDIAAGELDGDSGDNYVDLVSANGASVIARQNPSDSAADPYSAGNWTTSSTLTGSKNNVTAVAIGHINGTNDSYKDVVIAYNSVATTANLVAYKNPTTGAYSGNWTTAKTFAGVGDTSTRYTSLVIANREGSGDTDPGDGDIFTTRGQADTASQEKAVKVRKNPHGSDPFTAGTWTTETIVSTTSTNAYLYNEVALGDFTPDSNKYPDVVWGVDANGDALAITEAEESTSASAYGNAFTPGGLNAVSCKTVATGFVEEAVSGNGKIDFIAGYTSDGDVGQEIRVWRNDAGTTNATLKAKSFKAEKKAKKIALRWTTASETDSASFTVLRSEDNGATYDVTVGSVDAKGQGGSGAKYNLSDSDVTRGKTYNYKLQEIDLSSNTSDLATLKVKYKKAKK
ncbi:MAG: hypothetical protein HZA77_06245 [Candidatus Schekmanbacteria bacterium]|nr:hypothetical protein [Candidatus Schekmanbacteria bacterium]